MNRFAATAMLCLLPSLAMAAKTPELSGPEDCRVVNTTGKDGVKATWNGACRDGRAEGRGILEWHDRRKKVVLHFDGDVKAGLMHGDGYQRRDDGSQYEGDFAEGRFHGNGTLVDMDGRYDGQFAGGKRNGRGKMVYAVGGTYDGQWRDDKFNGTGTAVYPSGRSVTTEWVKGVRSDLAAAPLAAPKYKVKSTTSETGSRIRGDVVTHGTVPFEKTYSEMSEVEKRTINAAFPLIDDGDEPPYPLKGTKPIFTMLSEGLAGAGNDVDGVLKMLVEVDAEGRPTKASAFKAPRPDVANFAMSVVLSHKFKPAICAGKPCAMKFPFTMKFVYAD